MGHIVSDGTVIYSEILETKIIFSVICQYYPSYKSVGSSSHLTLHACITNGQKYRYSDGVESLEPAEEWEGVEKKNDQRSLKKITSKNGFVAEEVITREYYDEQSKLFRRRITWIIEVPKNELVKFFYDPQKTQTTV